MKNLALLLFLTLINSSYLLGQEINWMTIEEAELAVKKQPKKILIDVYTKWCGYCKKMDKTTFQDKEMIDYLNKKFYCVKMDGEDKNIMTFKGKEFSFVNKGRRGYNELPATLLKGKLSYPTFVYLDEDLRILLVMPGYRGPAEMLTIVSYLGSNKYKEMKWEAYINETKGEK